MNKSSLPRLEVPRLSADMRWELPKSAMAKWNAGLQAKAGENTIGVYEAIGADWLGEGVTAKSVAAQLEAIGNERVTVIINSPGGDVFEGFAIYNLLRDHPRKVTVRVIGVAASAASLIAMAGDSIQIARAGFLMMHNIWVGAVGNRNELRALADMLEPFDAALAEVYALRASMDPAEIAALLDRETWLSGTQAVESGFADELLPADQVEEKKAGADGASALRRIDAALRSQGLTRSERRALMKQAKGMPGAAEDPMQDAGDDATALLSFLNSISEPQ